MMAASEEALAGRAESLCGRLLESCRGRIEAAVIPAETAVGGGALPLSGLRTRALALRPKTISVDALEKALRRGDPPVIARIQDDRLLFDLRTLAPRDEEMLPGLVARALNAGPAGV